MNPTVQELVAALTLEEKAGLCSGADFWHTKAVARLGIPAIKVSDGPHGRAPSGRAAPTPTTASRRSASRPGVRRPHPLTRH